MSRKLHWIGILIGAGVLSQCASIGGGKKTGKESYSGILPGIRAPQSISYLGQGYTAGYSAVNAKGVLVEYFSAGEGPKQWRQMLALRSIEGAATAGEQVRGMKKMLQGAGVESISYSDRSSGSHGIDFMMPKGDETEFNIYKYEQGNGGGSVNCLQYAAVVPGETVKGGVAAMRALANKHRKAVLAMPVPDIGRP